MTHCRKGAEKILRFGWGKKGDPVWSEQIIEESTRYSKSK